MTEKITYTGVGVDYDVVDAFKRAAQSAARETAQNLPRGVREVTTSRGESAYLIETPAFYIAHVEEGLGTKNLVADEMYRLTGKSFYDHIAQDTVAMIVNDMVTLGARPLSVAMHCAVGDSRWFADEVQSKTLIEGWKRACNLSGASWGGGETPILKEIVKPDTVLLSGSAIGMVYPKNYLVIPDKIRHGDAIIFIESSGIHANGLTLARKIAEKLPLGYLTKLTDGRTYGETLLDPTYIYVDFVQECLNRGVDIHYAVNITGHGWRKLMRAPQMFSYVVETLPREQEIFRFIQQQGPVDNKEAYGTFNMGAGFALYVSEKDIPKIESALRYTTERSGINEICEHVPPFGVVYAGHIGRSDKKKVVVLQKSVEYSETTLRIR